MEMDCKVKGSLRDIKCKTNMRLAYDNSFTPGLQGLHSFALMRQQWDFFSSHLEVGAKSTFSVTAAAASCSTASAVRRQRINVNHMTQLSGSRCMSYISCFGHVGELLVRATTTTILDQAEHTQLPDQTSQSKRHNLHNSRA